MAEINSREARAPSKTRGGREGVVRDKSCFWFNEPFEQQCNHQPIDLAPLRIQQNMEIKPARRVKLKKKTVVTFFKI